EKLVFVHRLDAARQIVLLPKLKHGFYDVRAGVAILERLMVPPPDEARRPVPIVLRPAVGNRSGRTHDVARLERLRMGQPSSRHLPAPVARGTPREPRRPRVDPATINVPAAFVRLRSMKAARFHAKHAARHTPCDYFIGDVGRVLEVVRER